MIQGFCEIASTNQKKTLQIELEKGFGSVSDDANYEKPLESNYKPRVITTKWCHVSWNLHGKYGILVSLESSNWCFACEFQSIENVSIVTHHVDSIQGDELEAKAWNKIWYILPDF